MDLQGGWTGRLLGHSEDSVVLQVDGMQSQETDWNCQEWAVLSATAPIANFGWAAWSSPPPAPESFAQGPGRPNPANEAEGGGWVLATNCRIWLNGSTASLHLPDPGVSVPIPFWNGFKADRPLPWVKSCFETVTILDLAAEDSSKGSVRLDRASSPAQELLQDEKGSVRVETFVSVLGRVSFSVEIPVEGESLILRRTFDAFHGLQRARVLVNGDLAAWWHQPDQERRLRWAQDDLVIPLREEQRGTRAEITLEPPAGAPLFSLSRMEVWAAVPLR